MRKCPVWIVLAVALALRAALLAAAWSDPERFCTPDSRDYDRLARGVLQRGQYAQTPDAPPEVLRAPGYPGFLAAVYALTGPSVRAAIVVQVLLDVLLCWLVYRFGRRLVSPGAGLLAAAALAVAPGAIAAPLRLLSESLFALLLVGGLMALTAGQEHRRWLAGVWGGGLLGLACLVRVILLPLLPVLAGILLCRRGRRAAALAMVLSASAVVAPWVVRNYVRAGYPLPAGVGDYNLLACNALALVEAHPDTPLTPEQQELIHVALRVQTAPPDPSLLNDPDLLRRCRRDGAAIIASRPLDYALLHARTTPNLFLPAATEIFEIAGATEGGKGTMRVLRLEGPLAAARHYFRDSGHWLLLAGPVVLLTLVIYVAAAVGIVRRPWWRLGATGWLLAATGAYLALVPGPLAYFRFREPIEPLICLAAGTAMAWLLERRRGGSTAAAPGAHPC